MIPLHSFPPLDQKNIAHQVGIEHLHDLDLQPKYNISLLQLHSFPLHLTHSQNLTHDYKFLQNLEFNKPLIMIMIIRILQTLMNIDTCSNLYNCLCTDTIYMWEQFTTTFYYGKSIIPVTLFSIWDVFSIHHNINIKYVIHYNSKYLWLQLKHT